MSLNEACKLVLEFWSFEVFEKDFEWFEDDEGLGDLEESSWTELSSKFERARASWWWMEVESLAS